MAERKHVAFLRSRSGRRLWSWSVRATAWAIACCNAVVANGEIIPPGTYYGAYHVDRWGQHRFGEYFYISPDLNERLNPLLHKPLRMVVSKVHQPVNPGGAMFTAVEEVEELPMPLQASLCWIEPQKGGAVLRSVRPGQKAKIEVTLKNCSAEAIDAGDRRHPLSLACDVRHPPSAHYASQHHSYPAFTRDKPRWSFCREPRIIALQDQLYEYAANRLFAGEPVNELKPVRFPPGGSLTFHITLDFPVANEFEVALLVGQRSDDGRNSWTYPSNFLRLDVTDDRPAVRDGVSLRLERGETAQPTGAIPLKAIFSNRSGKTVRFQLSQREPLQLFAYDSYGTLLTEWFGGLHGPTMAVALAPGKEHAVSLEAPPRSALARTVFFHGYVLRGSDDGSETLNSSFQLVSPAISLTANSTISED